ncbi:unnamed protein product, partial [Pylaiella littoralis]
EVDESGAEEDTVSSLPSRDTDLEGDPLAVALEVAVDDIRSAASSDIPGSPLPARGTDLEGDPAAVATAAAAGDEEHSAASSDMLGGIGDENDDKKSDVFEAGSGEDHEGAMAVNQERDLGVEEMKG